MDAFLDQYNGKDGNPTVQVIFRDVGGDNPPRARQLAQEMIVNDNVAIMGGLEFTTTVLGVADVMTEAKMPFVAFNTATAIVTDKSPYLVRASFTSWQTYVPLAEWALSKDIRPARCSSPTTRRARTRSIPSAMASPKAAARCSIRFGCR